jgi:hypothetical protein
MVAKSLHPKNVTLPEPVVHPDAKLSDFLSTTATWRLVMSPKLKGILEKFIKEGQCQFLEMIEPLFCMDYINLVFIGYSGHSNLSAS